MVFSGYMLSSGTARLYGSCVLSFLNNPILFSIEAVPVLADLSARNILPSNPYRMGFFSLLCSWTKDYPLKFKPSLTV